MTTILRALLAVGLLALVAPSARAQQQVQVVSACNGSNLFPLGIGAGTLVVDQRGNICGGGGGGSSDPCAASAKSFADFESGTSGGSIVTAAASKKIYVCSASIITSAAANVSLIEGTGSSVCTGGTTAGVFLNTGVTAANGAAFAANGGIQAGSGTGTVAATSTANQNLCVAFTTTNTPQVNVHLSYVQQ